MPACKKAVDWLMHIVAQLAFCCHWCISCFVKGWQAHGPVRKCLIGLKALGSCSEGLSARLIKPMRQSPISLAAHYTKSS